MEITLTFIKGHTYKTWGHRITIKSPFIFVLYVHHPVFIEYEESSGDDEYIVKGFRIDKTKYRLTEPNTGLALRDINYSSVKDAVKAAKTILESYDKDEVFKKISKPQRHHNDFKGQNQRV